MPRPMITSILLLLVASSLEAQMLPIRSGDRVRLQSGSVSGEFDVVDIAGDTIILRDGVEVRVPASAVTALSVHRPSSRRRTAAIGAGSGLVAGTTASLALGLLIGEENGFFGSTSEIIGETMVRFWAGGALAGALAALLFTDAWTEVQLNGQPDLGIGTRGDILFQYSIPLSR